MLHVRNVSFSYRKQLIFKDITAQFPIGKIIGIAGANGCGKSTFIRLLTGMLQPDTGEILLYEDRLTRTSCKQFAYLPDIDLFYADNTGEEVFTFYQSQFADFSIEKARQAADYLQVSTTAKLQKLSKGKRALVKMAATLGRNVPYYIMDEPFSGLDPMVRESLIRGLIQFIEPDTQTIILSTHEIYEVEPVLDALMVIKDQQIIAYETLEDIRDELQKDAVAWLKSQHQ